MKLFIELAALKLKLKKTHISILKLLAYCERRVLTNSKINFKHEQSVSIVTVYNLVAFA